MTPIDMRWLAFSFAVQQKLKHPFDMETKKAGGGDHCLHGFMLRVRHPLLAVRKPEATRIGRAVSFNKSQVDSFSNTGIFIL